MIKHQDLVQSGLKVKHHSGREYLVLLLANKASTNSQMYPVTVVYTGYGQIWSKTLDDFCQKMEIM